MGSRQGRQRRRNQVYIAVAVLVGMALFMLGLGLFEMWTLVLVSYYVYWILKMD